MPACRRAVESGGVLLASNCRQCGWASSAAQRSLTGWCERVFLWVMLMVLSVSKMGWKVRRAIRGDGMESCVETHIPVERVCSRRQAWPNTWRRGKVRPWTIRRGRRLKSDVSGRTYHGCGVCGRACVILLWEGASAVLSVVDRDLPAKTGDDKKRTQGGESRPQILGDKQSMLHNMELGR